MNRLLAPVTIALVAALGVALAFQRSALNDACRQQEELASRLERLETRQKETAGRKAVEELQEQVARAEKKVAAASAAASAAAEAAAARPLAAQKPAAPPPAVSEEDLEKIVDARIEEKLQAKGAGKAGGNDRKMPLFDLAKELSLDDAAQARVAALANTAKKEIFDIIKTPRPDGTNMADELVTAFTSGDTAGVQKLFARLFTEKIPGTDTTYVAAVSRVQDKANQGLSGAMGADGYSRYQGMNLKPENIETGFDPWLDYVQQKGK